MKRVRTTLALLPLLLLSGCLGGKLDVSYHTHLHNHYGEDAPEVIIDGTP